MPKAFLCWSRNPGASRPVAGRGGCRAVRVQLPERGGRRSPGLCPASESAHPHNTLLLRQHPPPPAPRLALWLGAGAPQTGPPTAPALREPGWDVLVRDRVGTEARRGRSGKASWRGCLSSPRLVQKGRRLGSRGGGRPVGRGMETRWAPSVTAPQGAPRGLQDVGLRGENSRRQRQVGQGTTGCWQFRKNSLICSEGHGATSDFNPPSAARTRGLDLWGHPPVGGLPRGAQPGPLAPLQTSAAHGDAPHAGQGGSPSPGPACGHARPHGSASANPSASSPPSAAHLDPNTAVRGGRGLTGDRDALPPLAPRGREGWAFRRPGWRWGQRCPGTWLGPRRLRSPRRWARGHRARSHPRPSARKTPSRGADPA